MRRLCCDERSPELAKRCCTFGTATTGLVLRFKLKPRVCAHLFWKLWRERDCCLTEKTSRCLKKGRRLELGQFHFSDFWDWCGSLSNNLTSLFRYQTHFVITSNSLTCVSVAFYFLRLQCFPSGNNTFVHVVAECLSIEKNEEWIFRSVFLDLGRCNIVTEQCGFSLVESSCCDYRELS